MASCTFISFIFVTHFLVLVLGDVYVHLPRGSNNRINEKSADRENGNRMFDSQNNNKGGYNVGDKTDEKSGSDARKQYSMRYFQSGKTGSSIFPIEWTHQHGCGKNTEGDPTKLNCQVVLQYMCQPDKDETFIEEKPEKDTIRDGVETQTNEYDPPRGLGGDKLGEEEKQFERRVKDKNKEKRGMNEPYEWRDKCEARPRNKGLYLADQKPQQDKATHTRQNPQGTRRGYECPEERDYYPYWHPTDWKDIAILVEDDERCEKLLKNSFNTATYNECVEQFKKGGEAHYSQAETKAKCDERNGEWRSYHNYLEKLVESDDNPPLTEKKCHDLAEAKELKKTDVTFGYAIYGTVRECLVKLQSPDCLLANYSRVNHLGNVDGDTLQTNQYQWKLPRFPSGNSQRCVFRVRYNISTEDYPADTDYKFNKGNIPEKDELITGYPYVEAGLPGGQTLRLAINTAQFGRTFQDRSHVFIMRPRGDKLGKSSEATLYNLNVRGKRGNIVQTYPAVEYDFAPNELRVSTNDVVHVQWTGSNTHNNGNPSKDGQTGDDGEGNPGTDRSNILSLKDSGRNFFVPMEDKKSLAHNVDVVWASKNVDEGFSPIDVALQLGTAGYFRCYKCKSSDALTSDKKEMSNVLNNADASFEGMVVKFKEKRTHIYACTRNNNFSNRSQKAKIIVE